MLFSRYGQRQEQVQKQTYLIVRLQQSLQHTQEEACSCQCHLLPLAPALCSFPWLLPNVLLPMLFADGVRCCLLMQPYACLLRLPIDAAVRIG